MTGLWSTLSIAVHATNKQGGSTSMSPLMPLLLSSSSAISADVMGLS